jgi:REP element-mobilizing transposase RayT
MRTRYRIHDAHATYFVTSTIVEWLPVFTTKACCDILVNFLLHGRDQRQLQIYAWVILDNYFHAILSSPSLETTLGHLKRFTAHALLAQVKSEKRDWLINQFTYFRAAHKKLQEHQVWQEGVHPQQIDSDAVMQQKIDYIHSNPVKRGLVGAPEHWRYSSAHEGLAGGHPSFKCDPWR